MTDHTYDFEWDSKKADSNARKHGVTFEQAATVFKDGLALTVFDSTHSEVDERWFTLGYASNGALLALAHTFQALSDATARIRIISDRPASKQERLFYADDPR